MKILHLEDNREDAMLVRELLLDEWPGCSIDVVATRDEFVHKIEETGIDVILSDFTLISFTGLDALKIARERVPDIPFIFLSGTIGEDRAIEAVHAGARDYVLKDRMKRLITAIRRALLESQEQKGRRVAELAQQRFVAILENTPDFVGLAAVDGRIFYINLAGQRMIGMSEGQDPGLFHLPDFHPPEIAGQLSEHRLPFAIREGAWSGESALRARDGRVIPVSQVIIAHKSAEGAVEYFSTVMRDITASKEAERRIREQADLLNKARDAIIVSDLQGKITFWNEGAQRIFGWTAAEAVGLGRDELFAPGSIGDGETSRRDQTEDGWRGELRLHNKAGNPVVMDNHVTVIRDSRRQPVSHLSIGTDITAKKLLEEQFLRAQRLESIGMLAAGIAHDLNNVLAPILMGAPVLRDRASDPGDVKLLTALEKSAERGAALVRQILGFAQGVNGTLQIVQVKHIIRDLNNVIHETFPRSIRFQDKIAANLWTIRANPTQIHQILLNLCVNARDAMPQGGTLRLEAENCTLDELGALALEGARPGSWLVLHVEDSGSGIPPEVLAHIWEPFFTTKESGKGTGLGLPTVRGIVESHNGFISLRTEPGRGTVFRVYLPAAEQLPEGSEHTSTHPFAPRGNGELVLVVDDEPNVRDITAAILARHGYRVLVADDGTEAVALFAARNQEISLVITDLNMPNLDGSALANVVSRINPAVKILAISGMEGTESNPSKASPFASAFLLKPFKIDLLLSTVHRLLSPTAPENPPK